MNVEGKVVYAVELNGSNQTDIDLSTFEKGVYLLRVVSGEEVALKKLVHL